MQQLAIDSGSTGIHVVYIIRRCSHRYYLLAGLMLGIFFFIYIWIYVFLTIIVIIHSTINNNRCKNKELSV